MNADLNPVNSIDEFHRHRLEAIDLFERCLEEQTAIPMERWLQGQLAGTNGALQLFSEVEEMLHHRLIELRRTRLDVGGFDAMSMGDMRASLFLDDLRELLEDIMHLDGQIALVSRLHAFVYDWMNALSLMVVRRQYRLETTELRQ